MKTVDFLRRLADILDHDGEITPDQDISTIDEWDSLGVLSVIVFLSELGVLYDPEVIRGISNISELLKIVNGVVDG